MRVEVDRQFNLSTTVIMLLLQADWVNREYIELITGSIKRIADFLNSFDMSCRFAFVFCFY